VLAGYVAGYRWRPPAQGWTRRLPTAVVSVSDCLTDFLPEDQDPLIAPWHTVLQGAVNASTTAPAGAETAHVLAASVPASAVPATKAMIENWIGDYPHPIRINLAKPAPTPPGTIHGFEVLGFEHGRFHSWLCYGLLDQAIGTLGIHANDNGLLATLLEAQQVTDMANTNRGAHDGTPEDVTWFPALITEHRPPIAQSPHLDAPGSSST
jgi:hypothetical protein